jgi:RNA polymerase sigma-B factor
MITTLSPEAPSLRPQVAGRRGWGPTLSPLTLERNQRVEAYRELVRPIALHYARCSQQPSDDLIQVGLLGLIRAAELFAADRQIPFGAFARPHIRGAILHYLRDCAPSVRLPRRQAELQERLRRCPTQDHRAATAWRQHHGVNDDQWHLLLQSRQLNRPMPLLPDLEERLAAPEEQETPHAMESSAAMDALLARLEPKEERVVRQVVLAGWSYRRLAGAMGISPMTVKRLLCRGLDRLRELLGERDLSPLSAAGPDASALPGC